MSRRLVVVCVAMLAMICTIVLSLFIGTRPTAIPDVVDALIHGRATAGDVGMLVWDQRWPRTWLAIAVGAAMAVSGALVQGLTGNPLGDPGILGIASGAAFTAVLGVFLVGIGATSGYVWFAFVGAILAALLVFAVASVGSGGANPLSLVLAGAALSALYVAGTTAIILHDSASLNQYRFWVVGSLSGRDLGVLGAVAPFLVVGAVIALACGPSLNVLALGTETAAALGVNVRLIRAAAFLAMALLAAGATAAAGPLVFVGLLVPHLIRYTMGPDHRWLLPMCIPVGATLVLAADIIGRVVMRPAELQVGIVLAFVGVPFFIALVRRRQQVKI